MLVFYTVFYSLLILYKKYTVYCTIDCTEYSLCIQTVSCLQATYSRLYFYTVFCACLFRQSANIDSWMIKSCHQFESRRRILEG